MSQVQNNSSILVHITMKLSDGSAADSTKVNNKPAKIIMGDNSISPAFEAQLLGMKQGESKEFTLAAVDAFGESNPDNVHYMDSDQSPYLLWIKLCLAFSVLASFRHASCIF